MNLTRLEMYHILALLLERQNSGDYSGNPQHYYKRNNDLITKFEEETARLTRTHNENPKNPTLHKKSQRCLR